MAGDGYWEDIFQNRVAEQTDFWESALLCFTRAKPNGSWRDGVDEGDKTEADDEDDDDVADIATGGTGCTGDGVVAVGC